MKATLWLWSLVTTMLCISQSIYGSPLTEYRYSNSRDLQENFLTPKRTKPSLSIVNPLDVLRQRLLLEIARRQMKENTKQVELNRAILKNVGKRGNNDLDYYDYDRNSNAFLQNENFNNDDDENLLNYNNNNLMAAANNNNNNNNNNLNDKHILNNDDDYQMKYIYSLHKNNLPHK